MRGAVLSLAACCLMASGCGMQLDVARRLFMGAPSVIIPSPGERERKEVLANSYLVAFRTDLAHGGLNFINFRQEYRAHYNMVQAWMGAADGIKDMRYIVAIDLTGIHLTESKMNLLDPVEKRLFWGKDDIDIKGASIVRVDFRSHKQAEASLQKWEREGKIWYAEPNYLSRAWANPFTAQATTYSQMAANVAWYKQINLPDAFSYLAAQNVDTSRVPIIAVMDSGTDYKHPALINNIWQNPDAAVGKAGCTNDYYGCNTTQADKGTLGNGDVWPAGVTGANTACSDSSVEACPHGTHVAGLIAAQPQSDYGGVCPICKIMTVRVVGRTKSGEGNDDNTIADSSLIAGFAYISKFMSYDSNAVRLVNASFGKSQRSRTVQLLIRLLRDHGRGTLVMAAAGNEDTMLRQYPAAYEDVVGVANVFADTGVKHPSSNFGPWVGIAAPGSVTNSDGMLSSVPGGSELPETGTSMSTPVVTGVAALMLVQQPELSLSELRTILIGSSDASLYQASGNQPYIQQVQGSSNPIPLLGSGIVNAENAVKRVMPQHVPTAVFSRVSPSCGAIQPSCDVSAVVSMSLCALPFIFSGGCFLRRRFGRFPH